MISSIVKINCVSVVFCEARSRIEVIIEISCMTANFTLNGQ